MKIEELLTKIRNGGIKDRDLIKVKIMGQEDIYRYEDEDLYFYSLANGVIGEELFSEYTIDDLIKSEFYIYNDNFYIENLELRGNNFNLSSSCDVESAETLEIVKWDEDYENYITIGFWVMDKMGYNFRFIHDRFIDVDFYDLRFLVEQGQDLLNKKFTQNRQGDDINEL